MDVVLLLDASGSITETGFATLKALSLELVKSYALSHNGTKLSVATFAEQATAISALTDDSNALSSTLSSKLHWLKGPSNAGASLTRAMALMGAGGRKEASSLVLMVTDGRLVDPFLARKAADKLKERGIRLAFALVGTSAKNANLLESMASTPNKDNMIEALPDLTQLPKEQLPQVLKLAANRIVSGTCSNIA